MGSGDNARQACHCECVAMGRSSDVAAWWWGWTLVVVEVDVGAGAGAARSFRGLLPPVGRSSVLRPSSFMGPSWLWLSLSLLSSFEVIGCG
jgi:hypothetical protein